MPGSGFFAIFRSLFRYSAGRAIGPNMHVLARHSLGWQTRMNDALRDRLKKRRA